MREIEFRSADSTRFDVVGLGAMNVDYVVGVDDLDAALPSFLTTKILSETERLESSPESFRDVVLGLDPARRRVVYGGSTFNTLAALSRMKLGLRLGFAGVLGALEPDLRLDLPTPREELDELGIAECGPEGYERTGNLVVSFVQDERRSLYTYFDERLAAALRSDFERVVGFVADARVVHVTSIYGTDSAEVMRDIVLEARSRQSKLVVSLDLGHHWAEIYSTTDALGELAKEADFIFVNQAEFEQLGASNNDDTELAGRVLAGVDGRPTLVVLKKADECVAYFSDEETTRAISVPVTVLPVSRIVDPTGAGDVFAAGVLGALLSERGKFVGALHAGLAAARVKLQGFAGKGYSDLEDAFNDEPRRHPRGIFISHSVENAEWARCVNRLLIVCGIKASEVFCISSPNRGIEVGTHWPSELYRHISRSDWVISLVSDSYLNSEYCRYETGAAWALEKRTFTFVDSHETMKRLDPLLRAHQVGAFSAAALNDLRKSLTRADYLRDLSDERWEAARDSALATFLGRVPN